MILDRIISETRHTLHDASDKLLTFASRCLPFHSGQADSTCRNGRVSICLTLKLARHLHIPHASLSELGTGDLWAFCLIIQLSLILQ